MSEGAAVPAVGPRVAYVVGFLFDDSGEQVVLIRKARPQWQAGLLNGVGGKIEPGETPLAAMIREFREETGADTAQSGWRIFCEMTGGHFDVLCFTACDGRAFAAATTVETEAVLKIASADVGRQACVSNLPWLLAMATDPDSARMHAVVRYSGHAA